LETELFENVATSFPAESCRGVCAGAIYDTSTIAPLSTSVPDKVKVAVEPEIETLETFLTAPETETEKDELAGILPASRASSKSRAIAEPVDAKVAD
jgi:hypothetical protein